MPKGWAYGRKTLTKLHPRKTAIMWFLIAKPHLENFRVERVVVEFDVESGLLAHVVERVLDHQVHVLDQVAIEDVF